MIKFKKILCAVDHSECSYLALKYAISMALKDEAELYILHVIDTRLLDTEIYQFGSYKFEESDITKIHEDLMKSVPEGTTDLLTVETIVEKGAPFHEIVTTGKKIDADIIVIGTHGRTGLSHIMVGSVAEKVVRNAQCPVLTVRMPPPTN